MTVHADLHTHTTVTDGRATPRAVVDEAARIGLPVLVVTDHSVVTWGELPAYAARRGVLLPFPGIELSTVLDERRYHLTLFGPALLELPEEQRHWLFSPIRYKNVLAERTRQLIEADGHRVPDLDTIRRQELPGSEATPEKLLVSRTALARGLAHTSEIPFDTAYDMVAEAHAQAERDDSESTERAKYLPTLDVLRLARQEGLASTLAHPLWRCRSEDDVEGVVDDMQILARHGLDAVETRSYHHRRYDDHPALIEARHDLKLLHGGGSDYHANGKTALGADGLDEARFNALARRVESLRTERAASHA